MGRKKIKRPSRGEGGVVCFDVIASQAHPNRRRKGESEVKAFGWRGRDGRARQITHPCVRVALSLEAVPVPTQYNHEYD